MYLNPALYLQAYSILALLFVFSWVSSWIIILILTIKSPLWLLFIIVYMFTIGCSICHIAVVISNGFIHCSTTSDSFLRDNLDWLKRTTNWAKFTATASLGVIHQVCYKLSHTSCVGHAVALFVHAPRCDCFANPPSYHLSATKKYFRSSATTWWNSLLKSIPIDCNYNSFVFSVKDFYLNTQSN